MPRNKIGDLRNHLFAALERLNDESLTGEQLNDELKKSEAIANIGKVLVESAKVEVKYIQVVNGDNCDFIPGTIDDNRKQLPEKA